MNQTKLKAIACSVGGLAVILGGLLYILITDLYLLNSSQWLFYGIVCAFGSGLSCLLSEGLRHNKTLFYVLKGVGFALFAVFLVVVFAYKNSVNVTEVVKIKGYTTTKVNNIILTVTLASSILGIIGGIGQALGITLNILKGVDD